MYNFNSPRARLSKAYGFSDPEELFEFSLTGCSVMRSCMIYATAKAVLAYYDYRDVVGDVVFLYPNSRRSRYIETGREWADHLSDTWARTYFSFLPQSATRSNGLVGLNPSVRSMQVFCKRENLNYSDYSESDALVDPYDYSARAYSEYKDALYGAVAELQDKYPALANGLTRWEEKAAAFSL